MIRIINKAIFATTIIIFLTFVPQPSSVKGNGANPVEKMTFKIRWAFVVAGEATLEFFSEEKLDGIRVNHYLYKAKTSKFVDLFYKVRDRIESYTDTDLTRSIIYEKKQRGKSTKDITVKFDWNKMTALYSINGNARAPLPISPNTFDPLSVFYVFRAKLSDRNDKLEIKLTDGKRYITAVTRIVKKERIKVAGKTYNTLLVIPEMEGVSGVFKKEKNARLKIWVTDDKLRIPVRIKSKVAVGSFVADLVAYEGSSSITAD